jgi:hypothetical protein
MVETSSLRNLKNMPRNHNKIILSWIPSANCDDPCGVRLERVPYDPDDLPQSLQRYLSMAHECVNPSCKGVYFDHRYDVPLMFLIFNFILAIILAFLQGRACQVLGFLREIQSASAPIPLQSQVGNILQIPCLCFIFIIVPTFFALGKNVTAEIPERPKVQSQKGYLTSRTI